MTQREKQVFNLLIQNYSTKEIAAIMQISDKTVRNHISNVMLKLGVKGRAQAVVELLKLQELSL
ncbi:helix-turn-helix domain-containing protein [Copranaerobaculum intestinale]|uniref:helix-turn-helix domain-containing protein n=1 Tax=Copranaerobaculum intestinale TaxID=2692629 RepID=UPI00201BDBFA|nr:helix-turn-helix transcriptional regulator [Copranaerobaculum intestinale]